MKLVYFLILFLPVATYSQNESSIALEYGHMVEPGEDVKNQQPEQALSPPQAEGYDQPTQPAQATAPATATQGVEQDIWPVITGPNKDQGPNSIIVPPKSEPAQPPQAPPPGPPGGSWLI